MKQLEVNHIRKTFRQRTVVDGVSLKVAAGEIVGLLGPNGAGKTTTFLMILGLHRPDSGEILLNGRDITRVPVYRRSRLGISFLPQEPSVFRGLSVEDNVRAIAQMNGGERSADIAGILSELGLDAIARRKAYQLSGGERRRLEIARSLVLSPDFLLLDEPFAGIDPIAVIEIQRIIGFLKSRGIGVLITDHNVRETLGICDHAYIISDGHVLASGTTAEIIENAEVRRVYLGENFRM
jgi:lipopolysaccharide export system ATP-binding protein